MVHTSQNVPLITVEFVVNCLTHFGSTLYICGSTEELGHWTPHKGIKLQTNNKNYPQWTSHLVFLQYLFKSIPRPNTFLQFKACIISGSMVRWESLSHNRMVFTGSQSLQVYFNFDGPSTQVCEKKIVQLECRNAIDSIMNDMESDWGSSVGHPSNYPLQKFHQIQKFGKSQNRSQASSNLMSATDSEDFELEMKIMNYFNPVSLKKALSRPSQFECKKLIKKITDTNFTLNIISEGSETLSQSPKERSYRSLPKNYSKTQQKAIQRKRVQPIKSFPNLFMNLENKERQGGRNQNATTQNSQKKVRSEDETMKASIASFLSIEKQENGNQNDSEEDLFGLEIF